MPSRQVAILEAAARLIARRGVRGLRMEELAAEAGVSGGLLYYHFTDRATLLRRTLEFINERAGAYTDERIPDGASSRSRLEYKLLFEVQDGAIVIENSAAWGELRASALFEPELRDTLQESTDVWNDEVAELIDSIREEEGLPGLGSSADAAVRLTALVEGLSQRWLSHSIDVSEAQRLLRAAIVLDLSQPGVGDTAAGASPSRP